MKLVILPRTLRGLDRAGLRRHLETVHGPLVMSEPDVSGRFSGYVHHYVQDFAAPGDLTVLPDRDAVTIIHFPSIADLSGSKSSIGYRERVGPDEDNFRDIEGSVALLADERAVISGGDHMPSKLFVFRDVDPDRWDGWDEQVTKIVRENHLGRAIVNTSRTIEGTFRHGQFDEYGLPTTCEPAVIAARIHRAAIAHFGDVETRLLLTEPVRFL